MWMAVVIATPPPPPALKCASWGETGKMLANFIFNLPFCRRACRSGIASSEISSPLSWKHIGAEFASCRPPLPSAAIILRPHPALWPASLPGTGPVQNQKVALFNSGHRHTSPNPDPPLNPTTLHPSALPQPSTTRAYNLDASETRDPCLLPQCISYTRQGFGSWSRDSASHVTICQAFHPPHLPSSSSYYYITLTNLIIPSTCLYIRMHTCYRSFCLQLFI